MWYHALYMYVTVFWTRYLIGPIVHFESHAKNIVNGNTINRQIFVVEKFLESPNLRRTCNCFLVQVPLPSSRLSLSVTGRGVVDALAVWFDLHLDSQTSLSTAPASPVSSWDQAMFPVCTGMKVEPGDVVGITASCSDTQLQFQITEVQRSHSGTEPVLNRRAEQHASSDDSERDLF